MEDVNDLPERFHSVVKIMEGKDKGTVSGVDEKHLRYFYPDGAIDHCIERIGKLHECR